jgi:arsenical pump membrane protein
MVGALGFEKKKMIPFLFACGFIADTASVPLIVSNLANIVNADTLGISFNYYFSKMALPGIIAIVTVTITLALYFKKELRFEYNTSNIINPDDAVSDWGMFNMGFLVLIVVVLGYFIGSKYGIPVSFIAFSGALVLMIYNRKNKTVDIKKVIGSAPWGIISFAFGMYLIVYGLYINGFNTIMSNIFAIISQTGRLSSVFISGMVSTVTACTMNNLPAVMIGAFSVKDANLGYAAREAASLSNVIGSDIGAKLTPIGSLATILWMNIFKSKGINVSWMDYMKSAFFIITPVLILTLLVLGITI